MLRALAIRGRLKCGGRCFSSLGESLERKLKQEFHLKHLEALREHVYKYQKRVSYVISMKEFLDIRLVVPEPHVFYLYSFMINKNIRVSETVVQYPNPNPIGRVVWASPPNGVVKVNCDAAYVERKGIGFCGVGVVFSDHLGNCLGSHSIVINNVKNKDEAELEGVRVGLEAASNWGYDKIIVEVDKSDIAQVMKGVSEIPPEFYDFYERFPLKRFKEFNFTSIPREGNSVAHLLSQIARVKQLHSASVDSKQLMLQVRKLEHEIESQCFLESHGLPNFIHRIPDHLKKQHLSIGFFGHKGAGKCTVASHILLRGISGRIPAKNEERAETFMMDTSETERCMALFQALRVERILPKEKSTVLKLPRAQFDVGRRRFVISDSPALAADVDIGVLVVSAVEGEFDDAYKKGLQISETLQIAGANGGATKMIVVVNKMDIVNWSKDRYDEIKVKMTAFLKASAYNVDKDVQFLPVAAVDGSNMRTRVDESVCSWWTEGCLDEVLDGIEVAFPKALPRGNAEEYAA